MDGQAMSMSTSFVPTTLASKLAEPFYLVYSATLLSTISIKGTIASHTGGGILIDGPSAPRRVCIEHTSGHIAPVVVLEQPSATASNSVVGECTVLH